jgi:Uma2 family endonuclease
MNVIERQTAARSKPKIIGKSLAISEAIPSPEIFEARTVFHDVEPPRSKAELRVSEEEYWAKYYSHPDFSYEWNNGILEEKPMADYRSSKMYRWFFLLLNEYLKAYSIAKLVCLDIGFRLALPDKTSIRKPDLAVILDANPINIADDDCTYKGIFDLCIEFLSDSTPKESRRDTVVKKGEYCQAGVSEYFILDRKGLQTAFYRLTDRGVYAPLPHPGGIVRSEVLAGLQFRAADHGRWRHLRHPHLHGSGLTVIPGVVRDGGEPNPPPLGKRGRVKRWRRPITFRCAVNSDHAAE